jgi:hypothetical protein
MTTACILRKAELREHDMDRLLQELMALPRENIWRVTWEQAKSERSLQQNKYLWFAYGLIGKEHGYEKQDLHEDFLKKHFGTKLKKVPRCRECPDGLKEVPIRTTTTDESGRRSVLGKMAFAELVDFIQRYSAENYGVVIPDPDPMLRDYEREAA